MGEVRITHGSPEVLTAHSPEYIIGDIINAGEWDSGLCRGVCEDCRESLWGESRGSWRAHSLLH